MEDNKFISGRKRHLINKLRVTTQSLARDLPAAHRTWKTTILIPMIKEALSRIDQGTYGNCVACDQPISVRRLILRPEARCCTDCETDYEGRRGKTASA